MALKTFVVSVKVSPNCQRVLMSQTWNNSSPSGWLQDSLQLYLVLVIVTGKEEVVQQYYVTCQVDIELTPESLKLSKTFLWTWGTALNVLSYIQSKQMINIFLLHIVYSPPSSHLASSFSSFAEQFKQQHQQPKQQNLSYINPTLTPLLTESTTVAFSSDLPPCTCPMAILDSSRNNQCTNSKDLPDYRCVCKCVCNMKVLEKNIICSICVEQCQDLRDNHR